MQLPNPPKIPKRVIPSPEDYLQQRIQLRHNYPNSRASYGQICSKTTEAALLKYYPKYCRSLRFDDKEKRRSVISRIRQVKTVEKFLYDFGWNSSNKKYIIRKEVKHLFRNKRKSLRSLPIINSGDTGPFQRIVERVIMDLCPYFPNIQTLRVFPQQLLHNQPENDPTLEYIERKMMKSYGYFWCTLRSVQHLVISTSAPNFWIILPQLQSAKNFLSSLKSFRLEVGPLDHYDDYHADDRKHPPRFLFQILLQNQELLKYVTHLKFSRSLEKFHYYGYQVKSIIDCCSSLTFLSFPIESEFYSTSRNFSGSKAYLTLAPLQSLQTVRVLTLTVKDIWSFIEAFEFPLLLSKLTLHLYKDYSWRNVWNDLYPERGDNPADETAIKSYEKYNALVNFFGKFKRLAHLTSLGLNMPLFTEASDIMNNFILPLAKSIPNLENFECQLYQGYCSSSPFDISIFLDGIASLEQLKSFKMFQRLSGQKSSIRYGDWVMTFDPLKSYHFPNLTSVYIDTWIHEYFNFKKFFKIFSTELKEITLAKVHLSSIHSFTRLLRFFSNFEQIPSAKINITITLCLDSFDGLGFLGAYRFTLPKNVAITTNIYVSCPQLSFLNSTGIKIMQKALSSLTANITVLVPTMWNFQKKHIPIMKNNIPYDAKTVHNSLDHDREW